MTRKKVIWIIIAVAATLAVGIPVFLHIHRLHVISERLQVPIEGAVIQRDTDTKKELPISDVEITATDGVRNTTTVSDASGYFKLVFHKRVLSDEPIIVTFRHARYEPLELSVPTRRLETPQELYVAAMVPVVQKAAVAKTPNRPAPQESVVSNIRVRYTLNVRNQNNVASEVRTFQVVNKGDVPCDHKGPCSPDGKWKATSATISYDAGQDNTFGNITASCIAGPCPFTQIDSSGFIHGGRNISVTALNWSDTATFLLEAEVYHTAINAEVRELYPVIFGQTLNFTLPPTQEGVSIEAEIDGAPMVFPLGPNLFLSWATCNVRTGPGEEKTTVYRCELQPSYSF